MPSSEDSLPFATDGIPGVGGHIKQEPSDFIVEEIPLYLPDGEGTHLYLDVSRCGQETRTVVDSLADIFEVSARDIGAAGRKDKHACCRQWFSIPLELAETPEIPYEKFAEASLDLHEAKLHGNKLKRGHNLGNRFTIRIRDVEPDSERIDQIASRIKEQGLYNFFGPQRFGNDGLNPSIGKAILKGRRIRSKSQRTLMLNAYQSALFNRWLSARVRQGSLETCFVGDVAKVMGTGGLFTVEDAATEQSRLDRGEIHLTGPLFGSKMKAATGGAGALEQLIWEAEGVSDMALRKARLYGSRRVGRIRVPDLEHRLDGHDLTLRFELPKGSYATVLIREFTKIA